MGELGYSYFPPLSLALSGRRTFGLLHTPNLADFSGSFVHADGCALDLEPLFQPFFEPLQVLATTDTDKVIPMHEAPQAPLLVEVRTGVVPPNRERLPACSLEHPSSHISSP